MVSMLFLKSMSLSESMGSISTSSPGGADFTPGRCTGCSMSISRNSATHNAATRHSRPFTSGQVVVHFRSGRVLFPVWSSLTSTQLDFCLPRPGVSTTTHTHTHTHTRTHTHTTDARTSFTQTLSTKPTQTTCSVHLRPSTAHALGAAPTVKFHANSPDIPPPR